MENKNRIVAALCLGFLLGGIGLTAAYLVSQLRTESVLSFGNLRLAIYALNEDGSPADTEFPIAQDRVSRIPETIYVENVGRHPMYLRLQVQLSGKQDNGNTIILPEGIICYETDSEDWIRGSDGYDYYGTPLAPGECTSPLLTELEIHPEGLAETENCHTVQMKVNAYAVQVENNAPDVLSAQGWPTENETDPKDTK